MTMRSSMMTLLRFALPLFLLAACHKAEEANVAIDHDAATPINGEIEVVPPDEDVPDAATLDAENAAANAEGAGGPVMNAIHPIPGQAAPGAPGGPKR